MNYNELIDYLENVPKFSKKKGLLNIKILLEKLNNPQKCYKIIHVAGTNGKGSVCYMLSKVLEKSGYVTGRFTSPHLEKYNERIAVNSVPILDDEMTKIGNMVLEKIEEMKKEDLYPTFFEIITAIMFLYFKEKKVDIAIIEAGIGGKLDSTNIIENPLMSVITSVSIDHKEILGDNLVQIAKEKGGIIKKNCPTVLNYDDVQVYNEIASLCKKIKSKIYIVNGEEIKEEKTSNTNILNNSYQMINLEIVKIGLKILNEQEYNINEELIIDVFKNFAWPGRLEYIKGFTNILIDGAHNVNGAIELVKVIKKCFYNKKITFLVSFSKEKEYNKILEILLSLKNAKDIIFVPLNSNRTLSQEEIRDNIKEQNIKFVSFMNGEEAYKFLKNNLKEDELLCITGSLYLIGDMRKILKKDGVIDDRF